MLNFDDDFSEIAVLPTSVRNSNIVETKHGPPKPPNSSTKTIKSPKQRDLSLSGSEGNEFKVQDFLTLNKSRLSQFEISEIQDLNDSVYFCSFTKSTGGVDDIDGYLTVEPGDHILYRFEVKSILGKGSFAQVVSAYDHKEK